MANELGTATNFEDLFSRIVSFLTTNADLVAASQEWEVMRIRRDNLESLTSDLPNVGTVQRRIEHTFRYDPRTLNDGPISNQSYYFNAASGFVPGTSHITMKLRVAKEVKTLRMKAATTNENQYMIRTFRLQYSDDGSAWTTALTQALTTLAYNMAETKDFAVPGTPGAHRYWRIVIDSAQNGFAGRITFSSVLLLTVDGEVANHYGSEVILKAPGTSGDDAIYTGIRSEYDASVGWFNLFLNGYTGFDANNESWFEQPGALPHWALSAPNLLVPMVPCWNAAMAYWFVANGRAFRFVVKVSTTYEAGYLGFILPYSTPAQYPYPLAVGGSMVPATASRGTAWRYSSQNAQHAAFAGPGVSAAPISAQEDVSTTLYLRLPAGNWGYVGNRTAADAIQGIDQSLIAPFTQGGSRRAVWPHSTFDQTATGKSFFRECLGGGYALMPLVIHQRLPSAAVWGELEGCVSISGFSNSAENTATFGAKNYVVFPNTFRSTVPEYWALSLD